MKLSPFLSSLSLLRGRQLDPEGTSETERGVLGRGEKGAEFTWHLRRLRVLRLSLPHMTVLLDIKLLSSR